MTKRPATADNILRQIPTKWAIALIACLILYALLQPWMNQRFGWKLPSLNPNAPTETVAKEDRGEEFWANQPPMLQEEPDSESTRESAPLPKPTEPSSEGSSSKTNRPNTKPVAPNASVDTQAPSTPTAGSKPANPDAKTNESKGKGTGTKPQANPDKKNAPPNSSEPKPSPTGSSTSNGSSPKQDAESNNAGKKFGVLQETGRNRYQSPAGLIYAPGSEEGHRLKHIEKHLSDQPNRPGKHGVFDGDMEAVVRWIDDAYQRSMRKAKGTSMRDEDGRIVIEASFDKPIGYIGGRDGNRMRQPPAKRLRLVVDGKNVITAFPF